MKTISAIIAVSAALLAGSASAAPPMEFRPEARISMAVGQYKVLRFGEPVSQVNVLTHGTIEAAAQTDQQISIVGLAPGETQLTVFGADNKRLYDAAVTVTPDSGHLVRIYGTGKNDDVNAGHVALYCNEFGCGRPDKDLPAPQVTVERISRGPKDRR